MRTLLSLLVILAFSVPAYAADSTADSKKPVLVKGSKSYQIRYSNKSSLETPATVEPAAGVENNSPKSESSPAVTPSSDEGYGKKAMKLHGKK